MSIHISKVSEPSSYNQWYAPLLFLYYNFFDFIFELCYCGVSFMCVVFATYSPGGTRLLLNSTPAYSALEALLMRCLHDVRFYALI